ncbi:MAG: TetR/AcrR family transcriptional regulator [Parasphingorhabdus sp.]|uniref:TetR/AcrR family transcriptional regulator n=1 Tax=Parasphingorhabdus sp. TaxID=2709688 RepID=UPI0032988E55
MAPIGSEWIKIDNFNPAGERNTINLQTQIRPNTKTRLLHAGIKVFGDHGYIGGSVRSIAKLADANISAVKYHYNSKTELWKAVVSYLYRELGQEILKDEDRWANMTPRERVVNTTGNYIRFSAENPELYRITLFEMIHQGERLEWLSKNHMREFAERSMAWISIAQDNGVYPPGISPLNMLHITMASCQTIFLMAPQIDHSFGVNVFDKAEVEKHIDAVIRVLLSNEVDNPDAG